VISLDLYRYKLIGKNRGITKKCSGRIYELQPEGIDISSASFNHPNFKNKTVYKNFVGAVAHKGNFIIQY